MSLLERADALAQLDGALQRATTGPGGAIVMVGGEAGVGKTSLVRAFCAGRSGAWSGARCDALFTPRPLGPIVEIADGLGGDLPALVDGEAPPHRVAAALLGELRGPPRRRSSCWRTCTGRTRRRSTCCACSRGASAPASWSSARTATTSSRASTRCASCSASSRRPAPSSGCGCEPLSPAAVAELAGAAGVDATSCYRRTSGNPFFVTEVLAAAAAGIPDTVRDAVLARAARMDDRARALLEAISIVPPRIDLPLLEAIAGPSSAGSTTASRRG